MKIGIIGAGAWGTAIATVAADNRHAVTMWAREPEVVEEINTHHTNSRFLRDAHLDPSIIATPDLSEISSTDLIVNATPTQFVRSVVGQLRPCDAIFINLAKGIEVGTHLRVSEIVASAAPHVAHYAALSGPSHAEEVVLKMPTTVVCASSDPAITECVQQALSTPTFRVYGSSDVIGVEVAGALKNVVAIAAGIIDGLGLGDNTKAALITRGLAEITRLGIALGGEPQTFSGLAGLGDLFVTCASRHSRNRSVGERIGSGERLEAIIASMSAVAEGVSTTRAALELAATVNVELPITEKVASILFDHEDPREAIRCLMTRQPRFES